VAAAEQIRPDDDVRRHPNVYLGPDQYTLPRPVRYTSIGVYLLLAGLVVVADYAAYRAGLWGVGAAVNVGVWGLCAAAVLTYLISKVTDSDVPVRSVPAFVVAELRAWLQRPQPERTHRFTAMHVRGINPERDRMALRRSGVRYLVAGAVLFAAGLSAVLW
jgi:hypothetical protein